MTGKGHRGHLEGSWAAAAAARVRDVGLDEVGVMEKKDRLEQSVFSRWREQD